MSGTDEEGVPLLGSGKMEIHYFSLYHPVFAWCVLFIMCLQKLCLLHTHQNDGFIYFVYQAMDTLYNIYTNKSTTVWMAIGDGMVGMLRNIGRLVSSSDRHLRPGCKTKY